MVRKKIVHPSDLRGKIQSTQLIRLKTKLTVKIVKPKASWDFRIDKFVLPFNNRFYKLYFNLGIPPKTRLYIQIRDSKSKNLINEGIIGYKKGEFTSDIGFYIDQSNPVSHISITFKLNKATSNQLYYLYKITMESSNSYPEFFPENLSIPTTKDVKVFFQHDFFDYIQLYNFIFSGDFIDDYDKIIEIRNKYFNLLLQDILNLFLAVNGNSYMPYNLILFTKNMTIFEGKKLENSENTDQADQKKLLDFFKGKIEQNKGNIDTLVDTYSKMVTRRVSIGEKMDLTRDSFNEYKRLYVDNLESLRESISKRENFSKRDLALEKSEWELEKLNSLKDRLLKELNKIKKVKNIFDKGKEDRDNNEFIERFELFLNGLYQEFGNDILLIDEKIQDYVDVLKFVKDEMSESDLYREQKTIRDNARKNNKRINILQKKHMEYMEKFHNCRISQYKTLANIISLTIENKLVERYLKIAN